MHRFAALPILTFLPFRLRPYWFCQFYHFATLASVAVIPLASIFRPAGFNIFTISLAPYWFYLFYHFVVPVSFSIIPFASIFGPSGFAFYHFVFALSGFTKFTILSRLLVLPLCRSHQFSPLLVLTFLPFRLRPYWFYQFYHFVALVSFAIIPFESVFAPDGFNILPFRLRSYWFYQFYHFAALGRFAIIPFASFSALSVFNILPFPLPVF